MQINTVPKPSQDNHNDYIYIHLVDAATGKPVTDFTGEFISQNGIRCAAALCPTNEKRIAVSADASGTITVPRSIV